MCPMSEITIDEAIARVDDARTARLLKEAADHGATHVFVKKVDDTTIHLEPIAQGNIETTKALGLVDEKRFTLSPWYIPNTIDGDGDWAPPEVIQQAAWEYSQWSERWVMLQHNPDIVAGYWVELMTIPYEWTVPILQADGSAEEFTFPAGTVFLGVIWEPWAWELVKRGDITGLSIGGYADGAVGVSPPTGA